MPPVPPRDRDLLRELAHQQAEIAALDVHREKQELWRRLNRLDPIRPLVWIGEIPLREEDANDELSLHAETPFCRRLEREFRHRLHAWRHYPADMLIENVLHAPIIARDSGFGIEVSPDDIYLDDGSHNDAPSDLTEKDLEKITTPAIEIEWEQTRLEREIRTDLFGDILRVEPRAAPPGRFAPWDDLVRWRGLEQIQADIAKRPDLVHAAMDRLAAAHLARLDQSEELRLLSLNNGNVPIGPTGLGHSTELPSGDYDPEDAIVLSSDLWGWAGGQTHATLAPEIFDAFVLPYEKRWLERFGLALYDARQAPLTAPPNARKISISAAAAAHLEDAAEQAAGKHILSIHIDASSLNKAQNERETLRRALRQTKGCAVELILSDANAPADPRRLSEWTRVAAQTAEEHANA